MDCRISIFFAIQNSHSVKLGMLFTKADVPLSAIMIGNVIIGFLVGVVFMWSTLGKYRRKSKTLQAETERAKERLSTVQAKLTEAEKALYNQ